MAKRRERQPTLAEQTVMDELEVMAELGVDTRSATPAELHALMADTGKRALSQTVAEGLQQLKEHQDKIREWTKKHKPELVAKLAAQGIEV